MKSLVFLDPFQTAFRPFPAILHDFHDFMVGPWREARLRPDTDQTFTMPLPNLESPDDDQVASGGSGQTLPNLIAPTAK